MRRFRAWAGRASASLAVVILCSAAGGVRATAGRREASLPRFGRVVLIVFENKHSSEVLGSGQAPTFDLLARRFAVLTDYYGVAHPSLPNYLALVSGSTQGIESDCTDCVVDAPNLADTLRAADRTWKTYAEGLPRVGFTRESSTGRYAKRHNPFVYFSDVLARRDRLQRIVPLARLRADVAARRLPDFALVVPDTCHDMHDCPVASGDAWLASFLPPLLASPAMRRGVVFVVFDETEDATKSVRLPALVLGPLVRPGARARARLDHYSVLRTIEQAWGLPFLGKSATAPPITGIWRAEPARAHH
jgi:hypothetical protein